MTEARHPFAILCNGFEKVFDSHFRQHGLTIAGMGAQEFAQRADTETRTRIFARYGIAS